MAAKKQKPGVDFAFPRLSPEDVGIPSAAIGAFIDRIEKKGLEMHSFMLLRHGRVEAEGHWAPYEPRFPHMLFSLSKSVTATAVGFAIEEGLFALDDDILPFFKEEAPENPCENLQRMRVRDLLCMGTGHDTEPDVFSEENWEKVFLAHPVPHKPGTRFLYNTAATYMLASLVTRTSGEDLVDYLMPRLFEPLGIKRPEWDKAPGGVATGGFGLYFTTDDIARFGQLYLQDGYWLGKRVLPKHWAKLATSWQIDSAGPNWKGEWAHGYGFQFWQCRDGASRADGMFGQFSILMPEIDALFVTTCGTKRTSEILDAVFEELRGAFVDGNIPADPAAASALKARLEGLALPALSGSRAKEINPALLDKEFILKSEESRESFHFCVSRAEEGFYVDLHADGIAGLRGVRTVRLQCKLDEGVLNLIEADATARHVYTQASLRKEGGLLLSAQFVETPFRMELQLRIKDKAIQVREAFSPEMESIKKAAWKSVEIASDAEKRIL